MIKILNKEDCCGCNACGDVCPKNAIIFKTDDEGFWYPDVKIEKCIDCHLCEKVCPIINNTKIREGNDSHPDAYILQYPDNISRFNSTSGGLYPVLAEHYLKNGWFVAGHIYDTNFQAKGYITNRIEDLEILRNSKYLQSDLQTFYKQVKDLLVKGEKVLASGSPCQMAGLKNFLKKEYNNLLTVDFTCMGIDSPFAFRKYLTDLEIRYGSKIKYFKSKSKEIGWRRLTNKVEFENGEVYYGIIGEDTNLVATFLDILVRPSCFECKFKGVQRIADISLGDFWNSSWNDFTKLDFSIDDNSGTSFIMLNNDKAKKLFKVVQDSFILRKIDVDIIIKGNPYSIKSLAKPYFDRSEFYKELQSNNFSNVVLKRKRKVHVGLKGKLYLLKRIYNYYNRDLFDFLKCIYLNQFNKHIKANIWKGNILYTNKHVKFDFKAGSVINVTGECFFNNGNLPIYIQLNACAEISLNRLTCNSGNIHIKVWENASLSIGMLTGIDENVYIEAMDKVFISDFCQLCRNVTITDNNSMILKTSDADRIYSPVTIGTHCLIGIGSTVCKGVRVGNQVIVGENSVINCDIPPKSIAQGDPLIIKEAHVLWKNNI